MATLMVVALTLPAAPGGAASVLSNVGLVDQSSGLWQMRQTSGAIWSFYFGVPGDLPIVGDWDCDGNDSPGMFRPTNGYAYLRNSSTTGPADTAFYFGIPGDIPLAGDWDGDGCDTLAVYRNGEVFIRNSLGTGVADYSFHFGVAGDRPFAGDFDGDGTTTVGLYREASGRTYLRDSLTTGVADLDFFYGIPSDRIVAGDWDGDQTETVGIFRAAERRFYLANANVQGPADVEISFAGSGLVPVAGSFGTPPGSMDHEWDPVDFAHVYEVGPGQEYAEPGDVPWEALPPSSLVRIHYRAQPYRSKFVINTVGTPADPVVVTGVPDGLGRLPMISGDGAVTRPQLSYWNEVRSIVKVGGANLPTDDLTPAYVYIEGLDISSAKPGYSFTDDSGATQAYTNNAACIHIERGAHITLYGNELHDCGNGIFSGHGSSDVAVRANHIWGNGIVGRFYEHNSYTESDGIVFEYNRYGPLCDGCQGNNLKDRSAGTVIRYNWIEGGNRQLDLVETGHLELRDDPAYRTTFVYGNVLIEPDGAGNSQIIHYGGDGGDTAMYRAGTLHLYHNTIVSTRGGNTTLLRLSTNQETADVRNNVVFTTAGPGHLAISNQAGATELRSNWLRSGWVPSHGSLTGTVTDLGNLSGADPTFINLGNQDFHLAPSSPVVNGAGPSASATGQHPVLRQYVPHTEWMTRSGSGTIGAFE